MLLIPAGLFALEAQLRHRICCHYKNPASGSNYAMKRRSEQRKGLRK